MPYAYCKMQAQPTQPASPVKPIFHHADFPETSPWHVSHGDVSRKPATCHREVADMDHIKPNTHRRRRCDETVQLRRVGVGGVYMNS